MTVVPVKGVGGTGLLTNVIAISAGPGSNHSLALKSDGTVVAWGANANGQLGNGNTSASTVPVPVVGSGGSGTLTGVVAISAGGNHSVALKSDGTVWAWGSNFYGGLGSGNYDDSLTPVPVVGVGGSGALANVVGISGGVFHTIALRSDSTVVAWGKGGNGQLGNGNFFDSASPVVVSAVGGSGTLATVLGLSAGGNHSLGLRSDGMVVAWGAGANGQLGDGTFYSNPPSTPISVSGLIGETVIDSGYYHSLSTQPKITIAAGTNVFVQGAVAGFTFANVSSAGNLSLTRIDSTAQGLLPGYTFANIYPAYDVSAATFTYSGNIHVCLEVQNVPDAIAFQNVRLLQKTNLGLTDITTAASFATTFCRTCG